MSTGEPTTAPGREIAVSEPSGVVKKKARISDHRLDKAARELNMISINAARLKNMGTVGRFLDQVGVIPYGNGKLLATSETLAEAMKRCADLIAKEDVSSELKATFLDLQLRFAKAMDKNTELMVELNNPTNENRGAAPISAKPFLPGAQISPIQVNIHATAPAVAEKKIEEPCNQS